MNDFGRKVFGAFFLNESCNTYYQCSQKYLQFHNKELVLWQCKGLYCIKLRHLRHSWTQAEAPYTEAGHLGVRLI